MGGGAEVAGIGSRTERGAVAAACVGGEAGGVDGVPRIPKSVIATIAAAVAAAGTRTGPRNHPAFFAWPPAAPQEAAPLPVVRRRPSEAGTVATARLWLARRPAGDRCRRADVLPGLTDDPHDVSIRAARRRANGWICELPTFW